MLKKYYKKWKTLSPRCNLANNEALEAVKEDGHALQYVKEQTPEICLEAVKQDGNALRYVKEQTPKICLEAVEQNGNALQYVKEQMFQVEEEEMILEQVCMELGRDIKIIK